MTGKLPSYPVQRVSPNSGNLLNIKNVPGEAVEVISSESDTTEDIQTVIFSIDRFNKNYDLEIISQLLDDLEIDGVVITNLYEKSMLQAALNSDLVSTISPIERARSL